jgi:Ulp1 family protease
MEQFFKDAGGDFDGLAEKKRPLTTEAIMIAKCQYNWTCLEPGQWLTTIIILEYFALLQTQISPHEKILLVKRPLQPKQERHSRIFSNTSKVPFGELNKIFLPFYNGKNHFVLIVVDIKQKLLLLYDSFASATSPIRHPYNSIAKRVLFEISEQFKSHAKQKRQKSFAAKVLKWKIMRGPDGPKQDNENNCGVYVCKTAEFIIGGISLDNILASDMEYYRHRMALEIMVYNNRGQG